ncbi:hypothetical protein L7F22_033982 [Adiantum nelumboides]|nr:hypothetical protein [Adiantum nelumboides]
MSLQDALRDGLASSPRIFLAGSPQGGPTRTFVKTMALPQNRLNSPSLAQMKDDSKCKGQLEASLAQEDRRSTLNNGLKQLPPIKLSNLPTFAMMAAPAPNLHNHATILLGIHDFSVSNIW